MEIGFPLSLWGKHDDIPLDPFCVGSLRISFGSPFHSFLLLSSCHCLLSHLSCCSASISASLVLYSISSNIRRAFFFYIFDFSTSKPRNLPCVFFVERNFFIHCLFFCKWLSLSWYFQKRWRCVCLWLSGFLIFGLVSRNWRPRCQTMNFCWSHFTIIH